VAILLMAISGNWWLSYWWLLMAIILMVISDYFINGYSIGGLSYWFYFFLKVILRQLVDVIL
jgi:hypothetical protein